MLCGLLIDSDINMGRPTFLQINLTVVNDSHHRLRDELETFKLFFTSNLYSTLLCESTNHKQPLFNIAM